MNIGREYLTQLLLVAKDSGMGTLGVENMQLKSLWFAWIFKIGETDLQYGLFRTAKRHETDAKTGRFEKWNGTFPQHAVHQVVTK